LLPALPQLALSSGAACSSGTGQPSAVLAALGVPADLAAASLRLCFARTSTADEADFAADAIIAAIQRLRDAGS
jgi:cysteine desulfurase